MDLNKKFSHLFEDSSPRALSDSPIERSENYRKKLENKIVEEQSKFVVQSVSKEKENEEKYKKLLAEINIGDCSVKESILDSFAKEQIENSSYDKLDFAIGSIEEKTGWNQKMAMRKSGFWRGLWSRVSKTLKLENTDNDNFRLQRVYGKLLSLRNKVSSVGDEVAIEENVRDILGFELKCADLSGSESMHVLNEKMMGSGSFDKLDNVIESYIDTEENSVA